MHAAAHDTFMAPAISFYLFTIAATYVCELLQLLSILLHRKNAKSVTESVCLQLKGRETVVLY